MKFNHERYIKNIKTTEAIKWPKCALCFMTNCLFKWTNTCLQWIYSNEMEENTTFNGHINIGFLSSTFWTCKAVNASTFSSEKLFVIFRSVCWADKFICWFDAIHLNMSTVSGKADNTGSMKTSFLKMTNFIKDFTMKYFVVSGRLHGLMLYNDFPQ